MSPFNQILVTVALIGAIIVSGLFIASSVKCFDIWPFAKGAMCVLK
jgi:hypothetical protein